MLTNQDSGPNGALLSVIVIAHNEERYIDECLASILSQSDRSIELIVIDDCSSDGTRNILIARKHDFPSLRVSRNAENLGAGLSRNIGIDMAQGKYLMFVDGDDTLVEGCLSKIAVQLAKEQPDLLTFNHNLVYDNGLVLTARQHEILNNASSLTGDAQKQWLLKLYQIACNKVYRSGLIRLHSLYFNSGNYEDTAYAYKALLLADRISVSMEAYYNYRQRAGTAPYRPNKKEGRVKQSFLVKRYAEIFEFLDINNLQHFSSVIYSKMLIQFNAVIGERYDSENSTLPDQMKAALIKFKPEQIEFPTLRSRVAYWCILHEKASILVGMNRLYSNYRRMLRKTK